MKKAMNFASQLRVGVCTGVELFCPLFLFLRLFLDYFEQASRRYPSFRVKARASMSFTFFCSSFLMLVGLAGDRLSDVVRGMRRLRGCFGGMTD